MSQALETIKNKNYTARSSAEECILLIWESADQNHSDKLASKAADELAALRASVSALGELLEAVTAQSAPDSLQPIMWSGSPYQNHRMFAAIADARTVIAATEK